MWSNNRRRTETRTQKPDRSLLWFTAVMETVNGVFTDMLTDCVTETDCQCSASSTLICCQHDLTCLRYHGDKNTLIRNTHSIRAGPDSAHTHTTHTYTDCMYKQTPTHTYIYLYKDVFWNILFWKTTCVCVCVCECMFVPPAEVCVLSAAAWSPRDAPETSSLCSPAEVKEIIK